MLEKVLNRIKNSNRIDKYETFSTRGHRIDDRLKIETWGGHCTGIYIDGIEVKIYSKSFQEEQEARELIRKNIDLRINEIKQKLVESL